MTKKKAYHDFALVVPAYNEAPNIPHLIPEVRAAFEEFGLTGEVILVDDGSTDGTAGLAESEGAGWDRLHVLRHRVNQGKTEALLTAAEATDRKYLVLFDADLQHLPAEIPRFLDRLEEGWDIVTGRKMGRYGKRAVSSIYNALSRRIFNVPVSDLNSMKAFRADVLKAVRLRHDWHRFFVVLAHRKGFSATEIDIELHPRRAGEAKYSGKSRIIGGVLDLVAVWFQLRFSRKPMVAFGLPGVFLMGAGVLTGTGRAVSPLRGGAGVPAAPVSGRAVGHGGGAVLRGGAAGGDDCVGARRAGRDAAGAGGRGTGTRGGGGVAWPTPQRPPGDPGSRASPASSR